MSFIGWQIVYNLVFICCSRISVATRKFSLCNIFSLCVCVCVSQDQTLNKCKNVYASGIFGVPETLCADMYVKAAVDFSSKFKVPSRYNPNPKELHIVDIDEEILKLLQTSVEKWQRKPESIDQRVTLKEYLKNNPPSVWSRSATGSRNRGNSAMGAAGSDSYNAKGRPGDVSNYSRYRGDDASTIVDKSTLYVSDTTCQQKNVGNKEEFPVSGRPSFEELGITCSIKKLQGEKFRWGGETSLYTLNGKLTVKIYNGEIAKANNVDAIVCGIGKDLKPLGFIADALKKAGGWRFENDRGRMIDKNYGFARNGDVMKCDAGDLKVRNVIHVVSDKILDASTSELKDYAEAVYQTLKMANRWRFKKIIMPLFSSGKMTVSILEAT